MIQNIFKRIVNEIYIEYFKPNGWNAYSAKTEHSLRMSGALFR
mgnify:CR=1 FL=1